MTARKRRPGKGDVGDGELEFSRKKKTTMMNERKSKAKRLDRDSGILLGCVAN